MNLSNKPLLPKIKNFLEEQRTIYHEKHKPLLLEIPPSSHPLYLISLKDSSGICLLSVVVLPMLSTRLLLTYSAQFNLWPKCPSLICVIGAEQQCSLSGCCEEAPLCLSWFSLLLWEEIRDSSWLACCLLQPRCCLLIFSSG